MAGGGGGGGAKAEMNDDGDGRRQDAKAINLSDDLYRMTFIHYRQMILTYIGSTPRGIPSLPAISLSTRIQVPAKFIAIIHHQNSAAARRRRLELE